MSSLKIDEIGANNFLDSDLNITNAIFRDFFLANVCSSNRIVKFENLM